MKIFLKSFVFLLVSVAFVYLMTATHLVNWSALYEAFFNAPALILLVAFFQIGVVIFATIRYYLLLKAMHVRVDIFHVMAATTVGNGLGQWFPGSLAFIEAIRLALMLGSRYKEVSGAAADSTSPLRAKLAAVALFDRILGYFVMLLLSIIVGGFALWLEVSGEAASTTTRLWELSFFILLSFFFALLCVLLPLFSGSIRFHKLLLIVKKVLLHVSQKHFWQRLVTRIFTEIESVLYAINLAKKRPKSFFVPLCVSFGSVLFTAGGTYYAAHALGAHIGFIPLIATVSLISLANILPLGLGGIGGVQLVAAFSLGIFGVSFESAASAQLLQTAVNLVAISFLSILFLRSSKGQFVNMTKLLLRK